MEGTGHRKGEPPGIVYAVKRTGQTYIVIDNRERWICFLNAAQSCPNLQTK